MHIMSSKSEPKEASRKSKSDNKNGKKTSLAKKGTSSDTISLPNGQKVRPVVRPETDVCHASLAAFVITKRERSSPMVCTCSKKMFTGLLVRRHVLRRAFVCEHASVITCSIGAHRLHVLRYLHIFTLVFQPCRFQWHVLLTWIQLLQSK